MVHSSQKVESLKEWRADQRAKPLDESYWDRQKCRSIMRGSERPSPHSSIGRTDQRGRSPQGREHLRQQPEETEHFAPLFARNSNLEFPTGASPVVTGPYHSAAIVRQSQRETRWRLENHIRIRVKHLGARGEAEHATQLWDGKRWGGNGDNLDNVGRR
jgi:hypothetical protein